MVSSRVGRRRPSVELRTYSRGAPTSDLRVWDTGEAVSESKGLTEVRIGIVGGCGHVGLPLGLAFAEVGAHVAAFDIDPAVVGQVNSGVMPFVEAGAPAALNAALDGGLFRASTDPRVITDVDVVVVVIGTPVDEHLNPDPNAVVSVIEDCVPHMRADQLVILRSTVFPGVTRRVGELLRSRNLALPVVFCPERILEGHALRELRTLPQIIGADTESSAARATEVFELLGVRTLVVSPEEAELAKLFTNTWRYIKFAAANQFWLMANEAGLDYSRIRKAIITDYPRAADLPSAGFAAGPCLFKDTMQLAAFSNNNFGLGHAAMLVNEGQPLYVVDRISRSHNLADSVVGILGMAFKGGSDDTRASLSYKLKRILQFRAKEVVCTDPLVSTDDSLLTLDEVVARSDLLILAAPHREYRSLRTEKPVVDVWDLLGKGTLV